MEIVLLEDLDYEGNDKFWTVSIGNCKLKPTGSWSPYTGRPADGGGRVMGGGVLWHPLWRCSLSQQFLHSDRKDLTLLVPSENRKVGDELWFSVETFHQPLFLICKWKYVPVTESTMCHFVYLARVWFGYAKYSHEFPCKSSLLPCGFDRLFWTSEVVGWTSKINGSLVKVGESEFEEVFFLPRVCITNVAM